eukprot:447223_1
MFRAERAGWRVARLPWVKRPVVAQWWRTSVTEAARLTKPKVAAMDGNMAAVHVAYAMSESSFIYPISPATSMGEMMDAKAAAGLKNAINKQVVRVEVMQSEGGAAGAVHGALTAGGLSSTFTASQGLLLMIPNVYLIAGDLMPTVFHVSARTVAKHALSIFNDHSDVMACRQCGWAMLCSNTPQEVMDLGLVAHLATMKTRLPFMHFFDGYRTSAGIHRVELIDYKDIEKMIPRDLLKANLRDHALTPEAPIARGTGQRPDIFFQTTVAANKFYEAAPSVVRDTMREVSQLTGRHYDLFEYYGDPKADRVVVVMGSAAQTVKQTVDHLNGHGEKVGMVKVRLFRPWSAEDFMAVFPKTAKKITVLDRTREDGALGSPLHLDVVVSFSDAGDQRLILGGQYGLASKEFTPAMVTAIFKNLNAENPKNRFVVGINDDVTNTSLPSEPEPDVMPSTTRQCLVYGFGSDGSVGANKTVIKTIVEKTHLFAQGHFSYSSQKAGGVTISHLRFGPDPIQAEYEIQHADYVACHHPSYTHQMDVVAKANKGAVFVLNSPWTDAARLEGELPAGLRRQIAKKKLEFYNIDATSLALSLGLGPRINMIMTAVFYKLSQVLPMDEALPLLHQSVLDMYGSKGKDVVDSNNNAIDAALKHLKRIPVPESWASAVDVPRVPPSGVRVEETDFVKRIVQPMHEMRGDELPVSAFSPGGSSPVGLTQYEKRGLAPQIPVWLPDACTQCNYCALVCPHAVIRPFLLTKNNVKQAPEGYLSRKAKGGAEMAGLNYSIVVAPNDCTGCEVCVEACPDDALEMVRYDDVVHSKEPDWDFSIRLNYLENSDKVDKTTVKGSQFEQPLLEFHGACAGCGETPYVNLATRLFGERMQIANASGCSSVWGGTNSAHPYTTNYRSGRGPSWGRSLFEDNAEYGFGMALGAQQRRAAVVQMVTDAVESKEISNELNGEMTQFLGANERHEDCITETDRVLIVLRGRVLPGRLSDRRPGAVYRLGGGTQEHDAHYEDGCGFGVLEPVSDEDKYETVLDEWAPELYADMNTAEPEKTLLPSAYDVEHGAAVSPMPFVHDGCVPVDLVENQLLTPADYDRDIRHYEFDLASSALSYDLGDTLGVFPTNSSDAVRAFLSAYDLDADAVLGFDHVGSGKAVMPRAMSAHQLFSQVLDIFSKPKRRFIEMLSLVASDPTEKAELEHLISADGKAELKQLSRRDGVT